MASSSVKHHNQLAMGLLRIYNPDEAAVATFERAEDRKAAEKKRLKKKQAQARRAAARERKEARKK